jgi:hypothetical protein
MGEMTRAKGARNGRLTLVLALLTACGRDTPPPDQPPAAEPAGPAPERLLTTPSGVEVWFGDSRESRDSAGATCVERSLELRGPGGRRIVPLLYTLDTPTVLDDTTMRARLYTDCRAGRAYQVDLRTGLPTR